MAAWIALTVIGFVLFWPIGLALLVYIIWSKRMSCNPGDAITTAITAAWAAPATPPSTPTARRR